MWRAFPFCVNVFSTFMKRFCVLFSPSFVAVYSPSSPCFLSIPRFALVRPSVCSCPSLVLLVSIPRFAHVRPSFCSCPSLVVITIISMIVAPIKSLLFCTRYGLRNDPNSGPQEPTVISGYADVSTLTKGTMVVLERRQNFIQCSWGRATVEQTTKKD